MCPSFLIMHIGLCIVVLGTSILDLVFIMSSAGAEDSEAFFQWSISSKLFFTKMINVVIYLKNQKPTQLDSISYTPKCRADAQFIRSFILFFRICHFHCCSNVPVSCYGRRRHLLSIWSATQTKTGDFCWE